MGVGLGDIMLTYLLPGGDCEFWSDLKFQHPNAKIRLLLYSYNPQCKEFFACHPHVTETLYLNEEFGHNLKRHTKGFHEVFEYIDGVKRTQTNIYLDPMEKAIADLVIATGRYVAFHPFSIQAVNTMVGRVDFSRVIDAICQSGHRCVLLGGATNPGREDGIRFNDKCSSQRNGLTNLIGVGSVRLQAYLTAHANKFVGTASCYNCVAAARDVPSFIFSDISNRESYDGHTMGIWKMLRENRTPMECWDGGGLRISDTFRRWLWA